MHIFREAPFSGRQCFFVIRQIVPPKIIENNIGGDMAGRVGGRETKNNGGNDSGSAPSSLFDNCSNPSIVGKPVIVITCRNKCG